jgi:hypothetical protein
MTELTTEQEASIRKAAIAVVTGRIAELECCDDAEERLEFLQRLLVRLEKGREEGAIDNE